MKKTFKIAISIFSLFLFCIALSGCKENPEDLAKLKETCGYYNEDGDIILNDTVYKELPECEQLYPPMDYWAYSDIFISEKEMPLALIQSYCDEYFFSSLDKNFISNETGEKFFCKEELYDDMVSRIEEGFTPTDMCYSYDAYSEEDDIFYTDYYTLTAEEQRVVNSVLSSITPSELKLTDEFYYDWALYLEDCSSDLYFREYSVDIVVDGNKYYILSYPNETQTMIYRVPNTYTDTFKSIMKTYIDSAEIFWEKDPDGGYDYNDKHLSEE